METHLNRYNRFIPMLSWEWGSVTSWTAELLAPFRCLVRSLIEFPYSYVDTALHGWTDFSSGNCIPGSECCFYAASFLGYRLVLITCPQMTHTLHDVTFYQQQSMAAHGKTKALIISPPKCESVSAQWLWQCIVRFFMDLTCCKNLYCGKTFSYQECNNVVCNSCTEHLIHALPSRMVPYIVTDCSWPTSLIYFCRINLLACTYPMIDQSECMDSWTGNDDLHHCMRQIGVTFLPNVLCGYMGQL